jgi:hypothetical protein
VHRINSRKARGDQRMPHLVIGDAAAFLLAQDAAWDLTSTVGRGAALVSTVLPDSTSQPSRKLSDAVAALVA